MTATAATDVAGALPLVRAAWGGALLVAPRPALRLLGAGEVPTAAVVVARVLGARQVAQALLTRHRPTRQVILASSATDALHAASDVALAVLSGRWRRPAMTDAAIASGFAAGSWAGVPRRRRGGIRTAIRR
jgi:hypothetical protein